MHESEINKKVLEHDFEKTCWDEVQALVEKFNKQGGILRGDRLPSLKNNLSLDPIIWGQSIRPNFPITSYMEQFIDHTALLQK